MNLTAAQEQESGSAIVVHKGRRTGRFWVEEITIVWEETGSGLNLNEVHMFEIVVDAGLPWIYCLTLALGRVCGPVRKFRYQNADHALETRNQYKVFEAPALVVCPYCLYIRPQNWGFWAKLRPAEDNRGRLERKEDPEQKITGSSEAGKLESYSFKRCETIWKSYIVCVN